MKGNQKFKYDETASVNAKAVSGLIALLLTIIISVLIYFSVSSTDIFIDDAESFTGYSRYDGAAQTGSNYTGITITLADTPINDASINITFRNVSSYEATDTHHTIHEDNEFYPQGPGTGWNRSHRSIVITPHQRTITNFTMVNISYSTGSAQLERTVITPMAVTVFNLAPLIALVVVASIILGIIVGFGGKRSKV